MSNTQTIEGTMNRATDERHMTKYLSVSGNRGRGYHEMVPSEPVLTLSDLESCIRIVGCEAAPYPRLTFEVTLQGLVAERIHRLVGTILVDEREKSGPPIIADTRFGPDETLSRRELEVLHLVAAGLSNSEIGERLFVSLHTVKTHTRNIFAKLDVHNRTEAVHRARELRIL